MPLRRGPVHAPHPAAHTLGASAASTWRGAPVPGLGSVTAVAGAGRPRAPLGKAARAPSPGGAHTQMGLGYMRTGPPFRDGSLPLGPAPLPAQDVLTAADALLLSSRPALTTPPPYLHQPPTGGALQGYSGPNDSTGLGGASGDFWRYGLDSSEVHAMQALYGDAGAGFWGGHRLGGLEATVPPPLAPFTLAGVGQVASVDPIEPLRALSMEDDEDAALQDAIRCSLEEAEHRRREEEEAALAAQAAAAAAEAEEQEQRREAEEQKRREEEETARRSRSAPPPPGLADTFKPKQWLSDASISFAYMQLVAGAYGSTCGEQGAMAALPEMVLLMDPAAAFWLTLQDDPAHVEEAKGALKLQDRELVLCPINDNRDGGQADAGTHWSLLVCWDRRASARGTGAAATWVSRGATTSAPDGRGVRGHCQTAAAACGGHGCFFGRFSYYDSLGSRALGNANFAQARTLASRLAGKDVEVSVGACAKQTNGFDCGVYVLLFSELVAGTFLEARASADVDNAIGSFRPGAAPVWEDRLTAVTPAEVAARRAKYFETAAAAAAGLGPEAGPSTAVPPAPACSSGSLCAALAGAEAVSPVRS